MVQAPGIGGLVSAILEDRYRKQQQQRAMIQNITKTLGDAYTGYKTGQDNAGIASYMDNQINGPIDESSQSDLMHSLSPEAQIKLMAWVQQQNDAGTKATQDAAYNDARTNAANALANERWTGGGGGGYDVTPGQTATANREAAKNIRDDLSSEFDTNPNTLRPQNVTYGGFDQSGNWVPSDGGDQAMIGKPIVQHVPGTPAILPNAAGRFFGATGTPAVPDKDIPTSYANVFPRTDAQRALSAADHYRQLIENGGLPPTAAPLPTPSGTNGFDPRTTKAGQASPQAVKEAADVLNNESPLPEKPLVITPSKEAINYLKLHPETATQFNVKYGPGSAQNYF